jgi:hypothetical protein
VASAMGWDTGSLVADPMEKEGRVPRPARPRGGRREEVGDERAWKATRERPRRPRGGGRRDSSPGCSEAMGTTRWVAICWFGSSPDLHPYICGIVGAREIRNLERNWRIGARFRKEFSARKIRGKEINFWVEEGRARLKFRTSRGSFGGCSFAMQKPRGLQFRPCMHAVIRDVFIGCRDTKHQSSVQLGTISAPIKLSLGPRY